MLNYRSEPRGRSPRGYMEILYSILSVCLSGASKTHVMFRCRLNSKQLHFYIEILLTKGLLEKGREPPSAKVEYRTTQRGRKYLETYGALLEMLSEARGFQEANYVQSGERQ